MDNLGLSYLRDKSIKSISRINVLEDETEYLHLGDTFILYTDEGLLIQILIDYEVLVYELSSEKDIIVLGEYDLPNCKITIEPVYESRHLTIDSIYNYTSGGSYHFGSKFLDTSGNYIFGLCFGLDEVILIDESEFTKMVDSYKNVTETTV
ncbi:hypothetical protein ACX0HA_11770 [Flavobacterium hauense]